MSRYSRFVLAIAICMPCSPAVVAQGPRARPKVRVELKWVEAKRIEGITEEKGFQSSCDPDSIVYPHKAPALVLTAAEVAEARLTHHDFSKSGLSSENYMVALHLTQEAREKLAASCEGNEMRLITVVVDGKNWGVHRYEKDKDKPFVPEQARAATFTPSVGFFSSKADAERLVEAVK